MADQAEVVIVSPDGVEHVFPPGFDPQRAAAIVTHDAEAVAARTQGNERWGEYLAQTIRNIPRDVIEQAGGILNLINTAGGAAGELASDIGSVARDVVGLDPQYLTSRPNQDVLKQLPAGLYGHFKDYLDPNERALMVRDHPVGLLMDASMAKGAVKSTGKAASAVVAPVRSALKHPVAKVAGAVANMKMGRPVQAITSIADALVGTDAPPPAPSVAKPAQASTPKAATPASAPAPAAPPVAAPPAPPLLGRPVAPSTSGAASPEVPTPQIPLLKGETLHLPASARTPGQMSPAAIRMDVGLAKMRLKVTVTPAQFAEAEALVREGGLSPVQAVAKVARVAETPAAAAKLPALVRPTPDEAAEFGRLVKIGKTPAEAAEAVLDARRLQASLPGSTTPSQAAAAVESRKNAGEIKRFGARAKARAAATK